MAAFGLLLAVPVELFYWTSPKGILYVREAFKVHHLSFIFWNLPPYVAWTLICSPVLADMLTDPLVKLKDSIRRRQNRADVLASLAGVKRWTLKDEWGEGRLGPNSSHILMVLFPEKKRKRRNIFGSLPPCLNVTYTYTVLFVLCWSTLKYQYFSYLVLVR